MNQLFESQKEQMTEDHENAMTKQEQFLVDEREAMRVKLQNKIDELIKELRKERDNAAGSAKEMQERLMAEIADLKKQLSERTAQLADASQ